MSDTVILAIVSGVAPTLAAVGAIIIGVLNGRKSDVVTEKVAEVKGKVAEVHEVANSNFSRVTAELAVLTAKNEGLERLLTAATKTAAAAGRKTPL